MSSNLLVTKLYSPPARKGLVPRPRLVQRLDDARQPGQKLTLVSAFAGYGKTTLVAEWLQGLHQIRRKRKMQQVEIELQENHHG